MSQYKGVTFNKQKNKYISSVCENSVRYPCGEFNTEIEAVKSRDRKIMNLGLKVELQIFRKL